MKFTKILEIVSNTEFVVKNSILTKEAIDEWDEWDSIDWDDVEYDVEMTDEQFDDTLAWITEVSRQVKVAKHTPRFWVYGEFVECGDEDEI